MCEESLGLLGSTGTFSCSSGGHSSSDEGGGRLRRGRAARPSRASGTGSIPTRPGESEKNHNDCRRDGSSDRPALASISRARQGGPRCRCGDVRVLAGERGLARDIRYPCQERFEEETTPGTLTSPSLNSSFFFSLEGRTGMALCIALHLNKRLNAHRGSVRTGRRPESQRICALSRFKCFGFLRENEIH